jgi:hypothetical protein
VVDHPNLFGIIRITYEIKCCHELENEASWVMNRHDWGRECQSLVGCGK